MSDRPHDSRTNKKEYAKSIFIDAAKSIIIRDGIRSVTARKIGEETGYSYATLYHYYEDLNELYLETKQSMISDMILAAREPANYSTGSLEQLKERARFPVAYFLNYPNIFEFFFLYITKDFNHNTMKKLEIEHAYFEIFTPFVDNGLIRNMDLSVIVRTIMYSTFGMLTLCLSNSGLSRSVIYEELDQMIDFLLEEETDNEY